MKLTQLQQLLEANADASLMFLLPNGQPVPAHFHVTEVGLVTRTLSIAEACAGIQILRPPALDS